MLEKMKKMSGLQGNHKFLPEWTRAFTDKKEEIKEEKNKKKIREKRKKKKECNLNSLHEYVRSLGLLS